MTPPLWLVLLGMEFPAIIAMIDCYHRPPDHFAEGSEDRTAWIRWLAVAIALVPVLVGYGILLGYYFSVIRRNMPGSPE